METISLAAGDILYREGDASDAVFFIVSGAVEVRRGGPDSSPEVALARLGKGEMLGEMGVIRGMRRSTTIVATTPVEAMRIEAAPFIESFGGPDGVGLQLIRMLCERLAATNDALAPSTPPPAISEQISEIRLFAGSPEMQRFIGPDGVQLPAMPFEIGRGREDGLIITPGRLSLYLPDASAQLADDHLRIDLAKDGSVVVHDLGSAFGCIVNGQRISTFERFEQGGVATLRLGENDIVIGGIYSNIRLKLCLEPAAAAAA